MKALHRIFLAALLAGTIAGLLLAGVQHLPVIPMILEAETYETAGGEEGAVEQGEEAWAPAEGGERTFYTAMNSVIVRIGFGLLLTACYALRGTVTWRMGILWGTCGVCCISSRTLVWVATRTPRRCGRRLRTAPSVVVANRPGDGHGALDNCLSAESLPQAIWGSGYSYCHMYSAPPNHKCMKG